jgi:hypothetical protein
MVSAEGVSADARTLDASSMCGTTRQEPPAGPAREHQVHLRQATSGRPLRCPTRL